MKAILVDTGPLYASADPDDPHHRRATEEMRDLIVEGWILTVPFPVLMEAHTLVMRRLRRWQSNSSSQSGPMTTISM